MLFSWNKFCSAASNFTQTLQGWGWGGGGDIEKIQKECWSRSVDCLSLLQICYFYINNPFVMKAILFCNELFFRYIYEVGGETSAVGTKTIFPWLTNYGPGRHSSFHMMETKRWNPVKLLSFVLNCSITSGLSISLPPCLSMYLYTSSKVLPPNYVRRLLPRPPPAM